MDVIKSIRSALDAVARQLRSVDQHQRTRPAGGNRGPVADSSGAIIGERLDLGNAAAAEHGIVVNAIPSARNYRVQPENGNPTIWCSFSPHSGGSPIGAYDADTLVVGAHVRFIRHPQRANGLIIGIDPDPSFNPQLGYSDIVSQGSNTGVAVESGYAIAFDKANIVDWGGRTPVDSIEIGEFNRSAETGLMIHLDSYMTFLRANERSGIWCYYWDGLTRIAGENFQEWAGPTEREVLDDEGETMYYHGIATYPWEQQGMLRGPYTAALYEFETPEEVQIDEPYYARIEPLEDDTQPFHRVRHYGGYLGQGEKHLVCAPRQASNDPYVLTYSIDDYQAVGLCEQQTTAAGHWFVRSALGVTLAKRPIIPVPKRIHLTASQNGDKADNYKASGRFGSGSDHKVQPTPTPYSGTDAEQRGLYNAAGILDLHAHLFNWEGEHPFHYHEKDYYLPEESAYTPAVRNQEIPDWSELDSTSSWYLAPADYDTVTVDHRTGMTANIYRNTSYFTMLDDGGIVIGDGWGAEIRMTGGCIFLSCPGDIFAEAGRNVVNWAGRDINLRAWNCVDVTTTKKDIRLKAEQNLHMLAGNDQANAGGVLIECRSAGPAQYDFTSVGEDVRANGIILRALNTELVTHAQSIYMRTSSDDYLTGRDAGTLGTGTIPKKGDIMFDADLGAGDICTRSLFLKNWVHCAVMHAFPDEKPITQVNMFTADGTILCNDLYNDGDILTYGSILAKQDITAAGTGHFYSSTGGAVGKLTSASLSSADAAIASGHAYEAELKTWSEACWDTDLDQMWYYTKRPGNAGMVKSMWFSLRKSADYKADTFVLYESRWQQMDRLGNDTAAKWTEARVETNSTTGDTQYTYPFPGKKRLYDDNAYYKFTHLLEDTSEHWAKDRGSDYEADCKLSAAVSEKIDGYYRIVGKT